MKISNAQNGGWVHKKKEMTINYNVYQKRIVKNKKVHISEKIIISHAKGIKVTAARAYLTVVKKEI